MTTTLEHLPEAAAAPPAKSLDDLVVEWMQAKVQEEAANSRRIEIERQMIALAPPPEEGSATIKLDSGFKVTLTGKLTYSVDDMDALIQACSQWPAHMQPIKTVVQLDTTGAKFLRANEPNVWAAIAQHVTIKPAKVAVKVSV